MSFIYNYLMFCLLILGKDAKFCELNYIKEWIPITQT